MKMSEIDLIPTIPEFFRDRSIFITGGSGFMGKVLIEKILRDCPDVKRIFMLIRPKKGKDLQERVKMITDLPLFDKLKEKDPRAIEKIIPVCGDVKELGLGMTEEDRRLVTGEVSIVYHAAASVRFDDPLADAILLNTRGTREVIKLCQEMKQLTSFIHISTTYCNTDRKVIGEKIYPAHANWQDTIALAEGVDRFTLDILTEKYMGTLPNTYTFAKSLAEHVVNDLCNGKIPATIIRPSIVISTMKEPVKGWIDNFNGPVGLLVASGKGILKSVYTDPNVIADYVPVDLVAKSLIMAAWDKGTETDSVKKLKLDVYNAANNNIQNITMGELVNMGLDLVWEIPLQYMLWYPAGSITKCWYNHFIKTIIYHIFPAIIIDGLLKLSGRKPMLIKVHRKIFIANMALEYFITQEWTFINEGLLEIEKRLKESDMAAFSYEIGSKLGEPYEYFRNAMLGGRVYLLKEKCTVEEARVNARRMYILAQIVNFLWYLAAFYLLFVYRYTALDWIQGLYHDFCLYFTTK